jgi:hypothetical protein
MKPEIARLTPHDSVFVSVHDGEAELSCAFRLRDDRARGKRVLVLTLFRGKGDSDDADRGHLSAGLDDAALRDPSGASHRHRVYGGADVRGPCYDEVLAILDEVFRRTRARHLYLPLGVGGDVDHRIVHEAGLQAAVPEPGREVFLYEERPEALVPGAVRLRLGQLGARLPPIAVPVAREGALAPYLLRDQLMPHRRDPFRGLGERVACARLAARAFLGSRAWHPLKAFGPRLQPVVETPTARSLDDVRDAVRVYHVRRGSPAGALERLVAMSDAYARRLGGQKAAGHRERHWLLLP